jgi:hypothetical protein
MIINASAKIVTDLLVERTPRATSSSGVNLAVDMISAEADKTCELPPECAIKRGRTRVVAIDDENTDATGGNN